MTNENDNPRGRDAVRGGGATLEDRINGAGVETINGVRIAFDLINRRSNPGYGDVSMHQFAQDAPGGYWGSDVRMDYMSLNRVDPSKVSASVFVPNNTEQTQGARSSYESRREGNTLIISGAYDPTVGSWAVDSQSYTININARTGQAESVIFRNGGTTTTLNAGQNGFGQALENAVNFIEQRASVIAQDREIQAMRVVARDQGVTHDGRWDPHDFNEGQALIQGLHAQASRERLGGRED